MSKPFRHQGRPFYYGQTQQTAFLRGAHKLSVLPTVLIHAYHQKSPTNAPAGHQPAGWTSCSRVRQILKQFQPIRIQHSISVSHAPFVAFCTSISATNHATLPHDFATIWRSCSLYAPSFFRQATQLKEVDTIRWGLAWMVEAFGAGELGYRCERSFGGQSP